MTDQLLAPPSHLSPPQTLKLSQQAPRWHRSQAPSSLPYPLSILTTSESPEQWQATENLLISCLTASDDETASLCLSALTARFGATNERIQALQGLYKEATATSDEELQGVLKGYEELLAETPGNMPVRKRRVALFKALGRGQEAIKALVEYVDLSPVDAEAWAELGDMYFAVQEYARAAFCFEEVLLVTPNAWNIHARLGEVLFVAANAAAAADDTAAALKGLSDALRSFCRSVELCDDYLRGYYGLKLTSSNLLKLLTRTSSSSTKKTTSDATTTTTGDLAPPTLASVQRLHELSTKKLAEIVRRGNSGDDKDWDGYEKPELVAARELLDRDTQSVQR